MSLTPRQVTVKENSSKLFKHTYTSTYSMYTEGYVHSNAIGVIMSYRVMCTFCVLKAVTRAIGFDFKYVIHFWSSKEIFSSNNIKGSCTYEHKFLPAREDNIFYMNRN
jgi:hypothetical protein